MKKFNHVEHRNLTWKLKLQRQRVEISRFRRVEISKQTNAKADDSNYTVIPNKKGNHTESVIRNTTVPDFVMERPKSTSSDP